MARPHFLKQRARVLRRDGTDAERLLWRRLRNRQIADAKFRRQVQIDRYIVDFLCPEKRLIVELDGGQHSPEVDRERTVYLERQGFRLIRFWNTEVLQNLEGVLQLIERELQLPPHPPQPDG